MYKDSTKRRAYYQAHREEMNERSRKWHANNKERARELNRIWKAKNRELINKKERERSRERYNKRRDYFSSKEYKERRANWYEKNKQQISIKRREQWPFLKARLKHKYQTDLVFREGMRAYAKARKDLLKTCPHCGGEVTITAWKEVLKND